MPWNIKGATQFHEQLGLTDNGRAIKELVVNALNLKYKTLIMFQGAWSGLEPEATPIPPEVIM